MKRNILVLILVAIGFSVAYQNCAPVQKKVDQTTGQASASSSSYTDENGNLINDVSIPVSTTTTLQPNATTTTVKTSATTTTVKTSATTTTVKAVVTTTTLAPAPVSCGFGQELNTSLNSCVSCSSKGMNYSTSQKKCVAQCEGGIAIHIVQWDLTTVENAKSPLGYNILKGFKFKVNGQEKVIGQFDTSSSVPNSNFYSALMRGVTDKTGSAGVGEAFKQGVVQAGLGSAISVSMGEYYSHTAGAGDNNQMVTLTAQQVVLTGSGVFEGVGWSLYGFSPNKTRFISGVYCK